TRGPESGGGLERIVPLGLPAISGNHDTWLASLWHGRNLPPEWETSWWTPVRLAVAELSADWVAWLEALPATLALELPEAPPVRIVHGSPRHAREGMGRLRTDEQVTKSVAGVVEGTVIGAHIHYPYERWVANTHVVVVGAVGCPFNGDVNAQYGLFTWDGDGEAWRFEHRSVPYDHAPLEAAWES